MKKILMLTFVFLLSLSLISAQPLQYEDILFSGLQSNLNTDGMGSAMNITAQNDFNIEIITLTHSVITGTPDIEFAIYQPSSLNGSPELKLSSMLNITATAISGDVNYTMTNPYSVIAGTEYWISIICISCTGETFDIRGGGPSTIGSAYDSTTDTGNTWGLPISTGMIWMKLYGNSTSENMSITANNNRTNAIINTFNATLTNGSVSWFFNTTTGNILTNVSDGLFNITIEANNFFNNITMNYNSSNDLNVKLISHALINSYDSVNNISINNFTITYSNIINSSENGIVSTTNGNVFIPLFNSTYTITVTGANEGGVIYTSDSINLTANPYFNNYTFNLYPNPSVLIINVYDENTGSLINTTTTTLVILGDTGEQTYTSNNGSIIADNLVAGNYSLRFSATNYATRTYLTTVGNNTQQNFNSYLAQTNESVLLTIVDDSTIVSLEGANIVMETPVNGNWTPVENKKTDVTGKAQFKIVLDEAYRFTITKAGYEIKTFLLDPILFTSYSIPITKLSSIVDTSDYSNINIIWSPLQPKFYDEQTNSFSFSFISPSGSFTNYIVTATYPSGSTSGSGTNAMGQTFMLNLPISGAEIGDRVIIDYSYTTTQAGTKTYRQIYGIFNDDILNNTFADNINKTYGGLGEFEKIVLVTAIGLGAGGLGAVVGGITGSVMAILSVLGYAVYVGLLSGLAVTITVLVGIGILIKGGK